MDIDIHWLERMAIRAGLALGAIIVTIIGDWSSSMTALLILMAVDFASAWLRSGMQHRLSSWEAGRGTCRKFLMIGLVVVLGAQADTMLNADIWRNAVVLFYCASEGLSILENAVAMGLPVPDWLHDALKQLNEKKYVGESPPEPEP